MWDHEGIHLFTAVDMDPTWRGKERPAGRYVCRAEIPGNMLAEGTMSVNTSLWEWTPRQRKEFNEWEVVAFQVVDNLDGDSARGDFLGDIRGSMRPRLDWSTDFKEAG